MADLLTQSWNWLFSLGPSEFIIASFTTLILHEIFYFGAYLPYFIADYIPQLQKYKIQPVKKKKMIPQFFNSCFSNKKKRIKSMIKRNK